MEKQFKIAFGVIAMLLVFNLMATCSSNSKTKALTKAVNKLDTAIVKLEARPTPLTDAQIRDIVKDETIEGLYKYLIYETDLDKGKTSLSQIRSDVDRIKAERK